VVDGVLRLKPVEFAALFDGIDWRRVQATSEIPTPSVPAENRATMRAASADTPTLPEDPAALRALLLAAWAERDALASQCDDVTAGDCRDFRVLPVMREREDLPHGSTEGGTHRR
jgi:hypothetical protein